MTELPKKSDLPFNLRAFPASAEEKKAFFSAAEKNDIAALGKILEKWPNAAKEWYTDHIGYTHGEPVILKTLDKLKEETLVFLLQHGADINQMDDEGSAFPLFNAAFLGKAEQVEMLLMYGADVNLKNKSGQTALYGAANYNRPVCADLLVLAGATVGKGGSYNPLDTSNIQVKEVILSAQKRLQDYQEALKNAPPRAAEENPDSIKTTTEIAVPEPAIPRNFNHAAKPETETAAETPASTEKRKPFWSRFRI